MNVDRRQALAQMLGLPLSGAMGAAQGKSRNVIFILTDDHRYAAMWFLKGQSFLVLPHQRSRR